VEIQEVTNLLEQLTETRKANGLEDMPANEMLKVLREKSNYWKLIENFFRSLNEGFLVERKT
jgi:Fe-S cluster assembly ATP-binding protein